MQHYHYFVQRVFNIMQNNELLSAAERKTDLPVELQSLVVCSNLLAHLY